MSDSVVVKTRKFMRNPLLSRRQVRLSFGGGAPRVGAAVGADWPRRSRPGTPLFYASIAIFIVCRSDHVSLLPLNLDNSNR